MPSYASIEQFKETVHVDDTVDDAAIQLALDTATDWIENYCGRIFYQADTSARVFDPVTYDRIAIPDALSVSEVAVDSNFDGTFVSVIPAGQWLLYPLDVGQPGVPGGYTEIRLRVVPWFPPAGWISDWLFIPGRQVRVTATWGFPGAATPPSVVQACILLANRYFLRAHAPFGIQESAQFGTLAVLPRNDPDVISLLGNYVAPSQNWVAV